MKQFLSKLFFGKPEYNKHIPGSEYSTHWRNLARIWNNERHHDIGFEKILRLMLVALHFVFPGIHLRNIAGRYGTIRRHVIVEFYVLFKTLLPLYFLFSGLYVHPWVMILSSYLLTETVCYVASLIFVSDIFVKPRSYRRNILMLFLNYLEISFCFAVVYAGLHLLGNQPGGVFDYIYFSVVTSTTIGYGDFHPVSDLGKLFVCVQAVMVVAFIVLFLNFFGSKVEALDNAPE